MEIIKKSVVGRKQRKDDVIITVTKSGIGLISLTDDARNKLYSKRVIFGFENNRMYLFESESNDDGFKMVKRGTVWYVASGGRKFVNKLHKYCGRYDMAYDADKKAYYITLKESGK